MKAMRRIGQPPQIGAGGAMVFMGIATITSYLNLFACWLLKLYPSLAALKGAVI